MYSTSGRDLMATEPSFGVECDGGGGGDIRRTLVFSLPTLNSGFSIIISDDDDYGSKTSTMDVLYSVHRGCCLGH